MRAYSSGFRAYHVGGAVMSAGHTSGPWQQRDDQTSEGWVTIIGNIDGEYIDGAPEFTYDVICVCEDEYGERLPNVSANARLISASPELLEALQWIARNYENGDINHVDFRVEAKHLADAAIAKATGATS